MPAMGWDSEQATDAVGRRWPERTEWERYIEKIAPPNENGCMLWTAGTQKGYGAFRAHRDGKWKHIRAHRFGWEHRMGPIPDGLVVCHKCDVRACQNPDHWFLGTTAVNLADMRRKGRGSKPPLSGFGRPPASAKLTYELAEEIRQRYAAGGILQRDLALDYGVDQSNISAIIRGKTWLHGRSP